MLEYSDDDKKLLGKRSRFCAHVRMSLDDAVERGALEPSEADGLKGWVQTCESSYLMPFKVFVRNKFADVCKAAEQGDKEERNRLAMVALRRLCEEFSVQLEVFSDDQINKSVMYICAFAVFCI